MEVGMTADAARVPPSVQEARAAQEHAAPQTTGYRG